ncbi:MAG: Arm DNA-binding domain-containing protein [Bacteroidales bacterium]|nr:Arm DNA-binding domain-containing protein [Bacteroidales bacterium]
MRTNNTFGVQFITRTNKTRNGVSPLYARISVEGRNVEVSLKQFIDPGIWNCVKGMTRGKNGKIRALNTCLEQIRSQKTECYLQQDLKKKPINTHNFS